MPTDDDNTPDHANAIREAIDRAIEKGWIQQVIGPDGEEVLIITSTGRDRLSVIQEHKGRPPWER